MANEQVTVKAEEIYEIPGASVITIGNIVQSLPYSYRNEIESILNILAGVKEIEKKES